MAEETKEVVKTEQEKASTQEQSEATEKTFTQAELDEIIQREKNKAKRSAEKEYQAKMDEAEKLRKMNADEKAKYEAKKQADRIVELEAQINRNGLEKEASKMLSEAGIVADDMVLEFVVREDAEATSVAVNAFSQLVKKQADQQVSEMLKGQTPTRTDNSSGGVTKEMFNKMSYGEQVAIYQDNPNLFAELTK